eukprot:m.16636 g.16636  ORF g.16636 m.16636 type:complete len:83 (-) comp5294_c1_seq1:1416-1664(-)
MKKTKLLNNQILVANKRANHLKKLKRCECGTAAGVRQKNKQKTTLCQLQLHTAQHNHHEPCNRQPRMASDSEVLVLLLRGPS